MASPVTLSTRLLTPRLVLRPPRADDVPELRRALRRNAEHLRPWNPAPVPGEDPTSLAALSKSILLSRREWKLGQAYTFHVRLRAPGEPIVGRARLGGIMRGVFQNSYLGYWIDVDHQGRGIMTEAVNAVLEFAFETAGLHRVQAAVMPHNTRSLRVVEKAGFRREGYAVRYLCIAGEWEDHVIYAITREDWVARTKALEPNAASAPPGS